MDLQSFSKDFGDLLFFGACGIGIVCLILAAVWYARPKPIVIGHSGGISRRAHRHGIAPMPRSRSGGH
jgi:hypothetical protein